MLAVSGGYSAAAQPTTTTLQTTSTTANTATATAMPTPVDMTTGPAGSNASVALAEQTSNGTNVTVSNVTLPSGGFVAIQNRSYSAANGTVSSIVGVSKYLLPGQHREIEVTLRRAVADNQTITALAMNDTDGDRSFDYISSNGFQDTAYSRNGEPVRDQVPLRIKNATSLADSASITLRNQTIDGENVTVSNVTLPDGGFVVLHNTSLLPPSNKTTKSMRGTSAYLEPGTTHNVTIGLDSVLDSNATLLAVPYQDSNRNGSFEYVTSSGEVDSPYSPPSGPANASAIASRAMIAVNQTAPEIVENRTTESSDGSSGGGFQWFEILVVGGLLVGLYVFSKIR